MIGSLVAAILFSACQGFALDGQIQIHDPSTVVRCEGKFYTYGTGGSSLVSEDGWTWSRGAAPLRRGNIIARNQDDHVKNIAFLMDKAGGWSLAPAFDMTYSYNPTGSWTAAHQMTMNGKRDGFTLADFRTCAKSALMKRGRAEAIIEEVRATVARWPDYAEQGQVANEWRKQIQRNHRLELLRT